jgi:hypothetical protein
VCLEIHHLNAIESLILSLNMKALD